MTKKTTNDAPEKNPLLAKIETLETEVLQKQEESEIAKDSATRALADLENLRRREAASRAEWGKMAVEDFLKKSLPILLELNLSATHTTDEHAKAAIEKYFNKMIETGVQMIEPKNGDALNPEEHEVVMIAPNAEAGKIEQCLEIGWKFEEKVLMPAKVSAGAES